MTIILANGALYDFKERVVRRRLSVEMRHDEPEWGTADLPTRSTSDSCERFESVELTEVTSMAPCRTDSLSFLSVTNDSQQ
jgi:hypothetical protein